MLGQCLCLLSEPFTCYYLWTPACTSPIEGRADVPPSPYKSCARQSPCSMSLLFEMNWSKGSSELGISCSFSLYSSMSDHFSLFRYFRRNMCLSSGRILKQGFPVLRSGTATNPWPVKNWDHQDVQPQYLGCKLQPAWVFLCNCLWLDSLKAEMAATQLLLCLPPFQSLWS